MSDAVIRDSLASIRAIRFALFKQQTMFAKKTDTVLAQLREQRARARDANAGRLNAAIGAIEEYKERLHAQRVESARRVRSMNRKIASQTARRSRGGRRKTRRNNR